MQLFCAVATRQSAHFERKETTMKRFALLCLALTNGIVLLAQQPAEWRPNVAEDNKAASVTDTAAFFSNFLPTAGTGNFPPRQAQVFFVRETEMHECKLHVVRGERWLPPIGQLVIYDSDLDLAHLDPLSISVRRTNNSDDAPIRIYMEGTNNTAFVAGTETLYELDGNWRFVTTPLSTVSSAPIRCPTSDKKLSRRVLRDGSTSSEFGDCKSVQVNGYEYNLPFQDEDAAKRTARALMHAALQCGGSKAVSPF
jgi:hypothetical protein